MEKELLLPDFNKQGGLLPVIVQEHKSKIVLMLAYMNEEALAKTIETGFAYYYSRSRNRIWKKGESSGHVQLVRELRIDCDNDTILILVEQTGDAACHTGHRSCFYRLLTDKGLIDDGEILFDSEEVYGK